MAKQEGTVSIRIAVDTHKRITDKQAVLKLALGVKSAPTIDEVINAGLDKLPTPDALLAVGGQKVERRPRRVAQP